MTEAAALTPSELRAEELRVAYGARAVLDGVSTHLGRGQLVGVLGPNGSGKTTLVRCLMGFLSPHGGRVTLGGRALAAWPRLELAHQIAVVPQEMPIDFPLLVRELVLLGRVPHLTSGGLGFGFEGARDHAAAEAAMAAASVTELADRPVHQLSGGELRRAFIARALAQETPFLLLDEPTSGLDLRHQIAILDLLRRRARAGLAVLIVLHDVNLAAQCCDRVVILKEGRVVADGPPRVAMAPDILSDVYGVDLRVVTDAGADGEPAHQILVPILREGPPA